MRPFCSNWLAGRAIARPPSLFRETRICRFTPAMERSAKSESCPTHRFATSTCKLQNHSLLSHPEKPAATAFTGLFIMCHHTRQRVPSCISSTEKSSISTCAFANVILQAIMTNTAARRAAVFVTMSKCSFTPLVFFRALRQTTHFIT